MGYAYAELITPALIFDNPGITRDDLANKLESVFNQFSRTNRWIGINLLIGDLSLHFQDKYLDLMADRADENGIELFRPYTNMSRTTCPEPPEKFYVRYNHKNTFEKPRILKIDAYYQRVKKGDIYSIWEHGIDVDASYGDFENYQIEKIYNERKEFDVEDKPLCNHYLAKIVPIKRLFETEEFDSLEEGYQAHPEYRPENIYDLTQAFGHFSDTMSDSFFWKQEKGQYYLDPITFDRIPASLWSDRFSESKTLDFGHTDLVVTAEAIKYSAWNMLGRNHEYAIFNRFMDSHPDSKARYEKAVWDSHSSLYAKRQQMTITEFLRWRVGLLDKIL